MRKKVSTLLDDTLYRRAKLESIRQGKQISEILGEALELYLGEKRSPPGLGGAVARSWGALGLAKELVHRLVVEDGGLLDT